MKQVNLDGIVKYSKQYEGIVQEFLKRIPVSQFKSIDAKRIKNQFNLLQSGYCQSQDAFHKQSQHKTKNRYSDILVYNHNRLLLNHVNDFYLNASLMRSIVDDKVFAIFSQAPLPKTNEHFWEACYHYNVRKIIMLCSFQDPKRGLQAEKYWPQLQQSIKYQNANIVVKCEKQQSLSTQYRKTIISLNGKQGQKVIQHNHWTGWHDMKKPAGQENQILFKKLVDDCIQLINNDAGVGRTGTLGTMIEAIRCARTYKELSIFEIIDNMRRHRIGCVQTIDQYNFIYQQLQRMPQFK